MNHLKTGNAYFGAGSYVKYKFNGVELQETGLYAMDWRNYQPDIARFSGVDVLSESYDFSPYHFALNNPISYSDPTGMYSTDRNGNYSTTNTAEISKLQDYFGSGGSVDGVGNLINENEVFKEDIPELVLKGSKLYTSLTGNYFSNGGKKSIFNHLDKYIGSMATISRWEMDKVERWANSDNFALKITYGLANNAYITAQIFDFGLMERPEWKNPLGGNYGNLDGTPNYHQSDALMNTILTLAPYARGAVAARATLPEGIILFNRLESIPGTKGAINNVLNKGIDYINKYIGNGMKTLPVVKTIGNILQPDSSFRKWIKRNVGHKSEFY